MSAQQVVCRECHEPLGQITGSHLSFHAMSVEEYKEKHPDAPLQSEAVRESTGWTESHDDSTREAIARSVAEKHENGDYA